MNGRGRENWQAILGLAGQNRLKEEKISTQFHMSTLKNTSLNDKKWREFSLKERRDISWSENDNFLEMKGLKEKTHGHILL